MSLFLFCNENYGRAYAQAASRLERERGFAVRIIRSGRPRHGRTIRPVLRGEAVFDVNSPEFLALVKPGDHAVIAGFDQIFKAPAIERFSSFVNFHPALLPYYRGPLPSYWCLRNRETRTGYTLHRVTTVIDSGEILHQEIVPVGDTKDPRALDRRISRRGALCFARWLEHLVTREPWPPARCIDARTVYRQPREYAPYPRRESVSS